MDNSTQSFALNALQSASHHISKSDPKLTEVKFVGGEQEFAGPGNVDVVIGPETDLSAETGIAVSTSSPGVNYSANPNLDFASDYQASDSVSPATSVPVPVPSLPPVASLPSTGLNTPVRQSSPSLVALPIPQLPPPEKHSYNSVQSQSNILESVISSYQVANQSQLPLVNNTNGQVLPLNERGYPRSYQQSHSQSQPRSQSRSPSPLRNNMTNNYKERVSSPSRAQKEANRLRKATAATTSKASADASTKNVPPYIIFGSGVLCGVLLLSLKPAIETVFFHSVEVTSKVLHFLVVWGLVLGIAYLIYSSTGLWSNRYEQPQKGPRRCRHDASKEFHRTILENEEERERREFFTGSFASAASSGPPSPSKDELYAYRPYPSRTRSSQPPLVHPGNVKFRRQSKSSIHSNTGPLPSPTLSSGSTMDSFRTPTTPPLDYHESDMNGILSGDDLTMELEKSANEIAFKLR